MIAFRLLISLTDGRLQNAGYLPERTGMSVKTSGYWRSERSNATNTEKFDQLLMDAALTCFIFDLAYYGTNKFTNHTDALETAKKRNWGMTPEKNTAKTILYLSAHTEIPTEKIDNILSRSDTKTEGNTGKQNTDTESQIDYQSNSQTPNKNESTTVRNTQTEQSGLSTF